MSPTDTVTVTWPRDTTQNSVGSAVFYAAPLKTAHTTAPQVVDRDSGSFFSIYYCDDSESSPLFSDTGAGDYTKLYTTVKICS